MHHHRLFLTMLAISLIGQTAEGAEGGSSNYVPGTYGDFGVAIAPGARLTLKNDLYYYNADGDGSIRSGRREFGVDLKMGMNLTTLIFKTEKELFGGTYSVGAVIPIIHVDLKSRINTPDVRLKLEDDTTGLGDIAFLPLILHWNRDNLHWSFSQAIVTPTGDYDVDSLVNTGLNYWSFDTNFALTHLNPDKGREFSFNLGYIYNTENSDTDYQSGQEVHLDMAFNKYISDSWAIGLQGFYLKQITGDSGAGAILGDFKGEAAGIGPAVLWNTKLGKKNVSFIAKWLHEFEVEKRLEGDHFFLSGVLQF